MSAGLEMPVADALFWLTHDQRRRRRVSAAAVECALAAGLLAELFVADAINMKADGVIYARTPDQSTSHGTAMRAADPRPVEPLSAYVYDEIILEPAGLAPWLSGLRPVALRAVSARLEQRRLRQQETERNPWPARRRSHASEADRPWGVLSTRLARGPDARDPLNDAEVFMIAVTLAVGLDRHLLEGSPTAPTHARTLIDGLEPRLTLLVAEVRAALGSDLLANR